MRLPAIAFLSLSGCADPVLTPGILSERFWLAPADGFTSTPLPQTARLSGSLQRIAETKARG